MRRSIQGTWAFLLVGLGGRLVFAQEAPDSLSATRRPTLALQVGHSGGIGGVSFSPDGRILATESQDQTVRLWEASSGQLLAILHGREGVFSSDGAIMATTGGSKVVQLWEVISGWLRARMPGERYVLSPDGRTLATRTTREYLEVWQLWDLPSGRLRAPLRTESETDWAGSAMGFSADGQILVTSLNAVGGTREKPFTHHARLWETRQGRLVTKLPGTVCRFFPDSQTLVTVDQGVRAEAGSSVPAGTVRAWDVATGQCKATLEVPMDQLPFPTEPPRRDEWTGLPRLPSPVTSDAFALSRDGRTLAIYNVAAASGIGQGRAEARLWDLTSGQLKAVVQRVGLPLVFSPDGKTLATGSTKWHWEEIGDRYEVDGARLWDVATGQQRASLAGAGDPALALAFSADGRSLAVGHCGRTVLWDLATAQPMASLPGGAEHVKSLAFSPDGRMLATGAWDDPTPRLWNVARDPSQIALLPGHRTDRAVWAWSPDGRLLASAAGEQACLWDASTGELRAAMLGHGSPVAALAFAPDGQTVASGAGSWWGQEWGELRLWDVATGKLHAALLGHSTAVRALTYSPNSRTLAAGPGTDARLWDVETGKLKAVVPLGGPGRPLGFSPYGRTLAAAGGGGSPQVHFWDVPSGQIRASLNEVCAPFVFSPDGETAATFTTVRLEARDQGGKEAWTPVIQLRDIVTGQVTATFALSNLSFLGKTSLRPDEVFCTFSPDARRLAAIWGFYGCLQVWDLETKELRATLTSKELAGMGQWDMVSSVAAFSSDGRTLAVACRDTADYWFTYHRVFLWDVETGRQVPLTSLSQLDGFPPSFAHRVSTAGDAVSLHDPRDGRVVATFVPIPEVATVSAQTRPIEVGAKPIEVGAKAIEVGAKDALTAANEWMVITPEGYFDCSANAARFIKWNVNGKLYPAERYLRRFRRPDLVRQALRGERIEAPEMTLEDIPPTAQFVSLKYDGARHREAVTVTVEASGKHDPKEVLVLVNGRPLPPKQAGEVRVKAVAAGLQARPIEVGAKPIEIGTKAIELGAKALEVGAKPIEVGAKPAGSSAAQPTPNPIVKRFSFRVPLPLGAENVRLRAVAYDSSDLGSNPAEIALKRSGVRPMPGKLYALCVGLSRYRNGRGQGSGVGAQGFSNLKYPAKDAQSVVERILKEGKPLYEGVEVYASRALVDEQATLANIRAGLKWLQQQVRPGQVDTVVVFLSGHGVSDPQGHYYFPTYEFDRKECRTTSLCGRELQESLGGTLRAKSVFLFVDTCHSGALAGARGDDLTFEVTTSGVYMMASSGATQYSYESPAWGHGAFTYALLRSLARKELARQGVIHFNVLTYAVPEELAALMKAVGQNEAAMQPVVPLEGRRLDEPVAQVKAARDMPRLRPSPAATQVAKAPSSREGPVPWAAALREAKSAGRLLLVDVHAAWDPGCVKMAETLADREVQALLETRFRYFKVNVDPYLKDPDFLRRYDVRTIPYFLVLNAEGSVRTSLVGYRDPPAFLEFLRQAPLRALDFGSRAGWEVVRVDSQETSREDGRGTNVLDGDGNTIWHTEWSAGSPPHPHEIVIDLARSRRVTGFRYLPRQGHANGRIKGYEFFVSENPEKLGRPAAQGTFPNEATEQRVRFKAAHRGRYICLRALSEVNGLAVTAVAELGILSH